MDNKYTLKVFETYAELFMALSQDVITTIKETLSEDNSELKERKIKSLILTGYAFERNVVSPYFKWKAVELLWMDKFWNNGKPLSKKEEIWKEFHDSANKKDKKEKPSKKTCKLCNGYCKRKFNANCNPLCPYEETHNRYSIWHVDFCTDILAQLDSKDGIKAAYRKLIGVRGFSHKIASLILRDFATYSESEYAKKAQDECGAYYYFQPIDTWLQLIIDKLVLCSSFPKLEALMGGLLSGDSKKELRNKIRNELRKNEIEYIDADVFDKIRIQRIDDACLDVGVNPLKFNMGAWYFAAKVIRCREQLEEILKMKNDFTRAQEMVEIGLYKDKLDIYEKRDIIANKEMKDKFIKVIERIEPKLLEGKWIK